MVRIFKRLGNRVNVAIAAIASMETKGYLANQAFSGASVSSEQITIIFPIKSGLVVVCHLALVVVQSISRKVCSFETIPALGLRAELPLFQSAGLLAGFLKSKSYLPPSLTAVWHVRLPRLNPRPWCTAKEFHLHFFPSKVQQSGSVGTIFRFLKTFFRKWMGFLFRFQSLG